jgi:hypothetical protein
VIVRCLVPTAENVVHLAPGTDVRSRQSANECAPAFKNRGSEILCGGIKTIFLKENASATSEEIFDAGVELCVSASPDPHPAAVRDQSISGSAEGYLRREKAAVVRAASTAIGLTSARARVRQTPWAKREYSMQPGPEQNSKEREQLETPISLRARR